MSRSTPLENLPNQHKESSNAYDQNENTLVKEILQEIDTDKNQSSQQKQQQDMMEQQQHQAMMEQQHQAMMEQQQHQAMMEQQHQHQAMMEQQHQKQDNNMMEKNQNLNKIEINQHMDDQQIMNNQMEKNEKPQTISLIDKIKLNMRQPFIVGLIAIIVSIPALSLMLENMIKSKESLAPYVNIIILVLKGLFSGGLYFGINKSL